MIIYFKYLNYVIRHKWFVFLECCKAGKIWRGLWHDMSKFYPDEFIPYARYFYGDYPEWDRIKQVSGYSWKHSKEGISNSFDLAWLKHQHRNPHHWQHWLLQEDDGDLKILDMPDMYVNEMLADWSGAGRAITGKNDPTECKKWYLKNYKRIDLSGWTRTRVNAYFKISMIDLQETEIGQKVSRTEIKQILKRILEKAEQERKLQKDY